MPGQGSSLGVDDAVADADGFVTNILELPEELLVRVLGAAPDVLTVMRLAATCHLFAQVATTDSLWLVRLQVDLGVTDTLEPTASGLQRYRGFYTLNQLYWQPLGYDDSDASRLLLQRPRTGSATCQLGTSSLVFGGTLGGNSGPFVDDLFSVHFDCQSRRIGIRIISLGDEHDDEAGVGTGPGPRRGHTFTCVDVGGGRSVALVLGGWGYSELDMSPYLLTATPRTPRGYTWTSPQISGTPPEARAFHSATDIGRGRVLVYGGLGRACCRSDFALLDLIACAWSVPLVSGGPPRCLGGRAGHGAVFVPRQYTAPATAANVSCAHPSSRPSESTHQEQCEKEDGGEAEGSRTTDEMHASEQEGAREYMQESARTMSEALDTVHAGQSGEGGRLFLIAGASRSVRGDTHQTSVDVIHVCYDDSNCPSASSADCDSGPCVLRWSRDQRLETVQVKPVRTALYARISNYIVTCGGIGDHGTGACDVVEAMHVNELCVHRPSLAYSPTRTPARSGMLAIPLTSVPRARGGGGGKIGEVGGGNGAGGGEDDGNGGEEGGELTLDGVLMLGGEGARDNDVFYEMASSTAAEARSGQLATPYLLTVPLPQIGGIPSQMEYI